MRNLRRMRDYYRIYENQPELVQKTMRICGTQFKNEGELEQVLITHHHESIISAQDFETVQQMKIERAKTPTQNCDMRISL